MRCARGCLLLGWILWSHVDIDTEALMKGFQIVPAAPRAVEGFDSKKECLDAVRIRLEAIKGRSLLRYTCWPVGHTPAFFP